MNIQITELTNRGDKRGFSFSPPPETFHFLGRVADMHLASTAPGSIRGNHFHLHKQEILIILPGAAWSLHWDEGQGTPIQRRVFDGSTAVLVQISPGCSHAVRNDGTATMWLFACSSEPYDPASVVVRKVV